jgi:hypothetical protein
MEMHSRKNPCSFSRHSIQSDYGDSRFNREQQVVRGLAPATRDECRPLACAPLSTWQGRGTPPSVASFPNAATGGNGNPAGFRTFPPALRSAASFMASAPMNASLTPAAKRSSGSESRVRVHKVDTRWDGIEHASLAAAAQTAGLTKGGYIRALVLGCPGPRSQRAPSINAQALAQATAALNKVASNLNQVARVLNSGGATVTTRECFSAISEVRLALASILNAVGREARS